MADRDPTRRAREVVARHLVSGERIETALPGGFYDPPRRTSLSRHLEGFLGVRLGRDRALVVTNRRLLVLSLHAKDGPGEGWYVAQLGTGRGLRATAWQSRGDLRLLRLDGPMGERRLVVRARHEDRARTLAKALRLTPG